MQQAIRRLSNCVARCAFTVTVSSLALAESPKGTLRIKLDHLRNGNGQVGCALFASERGFPKEEKYASQRKLCPILNNQGQCAFEPIAPGTYAVVCFHDENGNAKLDTGFFGIPTEGVAASNNARGSMGPPKWEDARFRMPQEDAELKLDVSY